MKISNSFVDFEHYDHETMINYDLSCQFKIGDIVRTKDSIGKIINIFSNGVIEISDGQKYSLFNYKNISLATNEDKTQIFVVEKWKFLSNFSRTLLKTVPIYHL